MISPCTLTSRGFSLWWGYLVKPLVLCDVLPRWDPHSGFTRMGTERHVKQWASPIVLKLQLQPKERKVSFPQSFSLFSILYISVFPAKEFPEVWGKKIGASSEEKNNDEFLYFLSAIGVPVSGLQDEN